MKLSTLFAAATMVAAPAFAQVTPVADVVKVVPFTASDNFVLFSEGFVFRGTACDTDDCLVRGGPNAARLSATVNTVAGGRYFWQTQFGQLSTVLNTPRPGGSMRFYWNGQLVGSYDDVDPMTAPLARFLNLVATGSKSTFEIFARQPQPTPGAGTLYFGPASSLYRQTGIGPVPTPVGVPEPSTWAMMLGGFGFIGAAARRGTQISYA